MAAAKKQEKVLMAEIESLTAKIDIHEKTLNEWIEQRDSMREKLSSLEERRSTTIQAAVQKAVSDDVSPEELATRIRESQDERQGYQQLRDTVSDLNDQIDKLTEINAGLVGERRKLEAQVNALQRESTLRSAFVKWNEMVAGFKQYEKAHTELMRTLRELYETNDFVKWCDPVLRKIATNDQTFEHVVSNTSFQGLNPVTLINSLSSNYNLRDNPFYGQRRKISEESDFRKAHAFRGFAAAFHAKSNI